jgi:hypothetical protein
MPGCVGIIANPASGKDIRRLVAHASVFGNDEKVNILRRVLLGLEATGVRRVLALPEPYRLCERALDGSGAELCLEFCAVPGTGDDDDTIAATRAMVTAGVACVVTLGGDGTNRAVARGTCAVPLVAVSTGTNNVFPAMIEGTAAGLAAGALAAGCIRPEEVAPRAKVLRLSGPGIDDLALIDVVQMEPGFTGARAIWEIERVRRVLLTHASAAAMGMAALGGVLRYVGTQDEHGLDVWVRARPHPPTPSPTPSAGSAGGPPQTCKGEGEQDLDTSPVSRALAPRLEEVRAFGGGGLRVRAPIAPGMIVPVDVASVSELAPDVPVCLAGPCLIALDGERGLPVPAGSSVTVTLRHDGPPLVDVERCLRLAAGRGFFKD